MIIPSKQLLLIHAAESKQIFMFDAKTGCVLHKFISESSLASTVSYYQPAQQLLIPHLNNTYVNIWDCDTQDPKKFSIGQGEIISALYIHENSIAFMGSGNGNIYLFQLPSGINLRKVSLHSKPIIKINLLQSGHLITCSANEVKLWAMSDILTEKKTPIAKKSIHSAAQIIDVAFSRNILCIINQNAIRLYYSYTLTVFEKQLPEFKNITCVCPSRTGFYVANAHGKIKLLKLDQNSREFAEKSDNNKQIVINKIPNSFEIDAKDPITSLIYMQSLSLLISGNCKGEIKIWENNKLKNSMHLFKSSICNLFCFPRPNRSLKISQSAKIKALHKQQLTKLEQPIIVYSQSKAEKVNDKSEEQYLYTMLEYMDDPTDFLLEENEILRNENKQLLDANLHYQTLFQFKSAENNE